MKYSNDIYTKAEQVLKERKNKSEAEVNEKYEDLYRVNKKLLEYRKDLNKTGVEIYKCFLSKEKSKTNILKLKEKTELLNASIKDVLVQLKLPDNYLEERHFCNLCNDTGYVENVKCSCFKTILSNIYFSQINGNSSMKLKSFDSFDLSFFDGLDKVQRNIMTKNFNFCVNYAKDFSIMSGSLFMSGGSGLGKTHLTTSIIEKVLNAGYSVIYDKAYSLFNEIEKQKFKNDKNDDLLKCCEICDLLVLDDLGSENINQLSKTTLYNIISTRIDNDKPTIINTYYDFKELEKKYEDKLIRKIVNFSLLNFVGIDINYIKNKSKKVKGI
ncbi:MAG: ATP-binding protein [Oscillospiraceae bacterium]